MIITQSIISALTLNTLYSVKFATLQHTPDYIKISADSGGLATLQYYDVTGSTLLKTTTAVADNTAVWIIDLTQ